MCPPFFAPGDSTPACGAVLFPIINASNGLRFDSVAAFFDGYSLKCFAIILNAFFTLAMDSF
jgi:hypothetical protein